MQCNAILYHSTLISSKLIVWPKKHWIQKNSSANEDHKRVIETCPQLINHQLIDITKSDWSKIVRQIKVRIL